MSWVKYRLEYLRQWRNAVKAILEAARSLGLDAEVYVIGGVAEGRLTVLSDVDVLVCVRGDMTSLELYELKKRIFAKAVDEHGLPWDYPLDLHVYTIEQCREILRRHCKKFLKAEEV